MITRLKEKVWWEDRRQQHARLLYSQRAEYLPPLAAAHTLLQSFAARFPTQEGKTKHKTMATSRRKAFLPFMISSICEQLRNLPTPDFRKVEKFRRVETFPSYPELGFEACGAPDGNFLFDHLRPVFPDASFSSLHAYRAEDKPALRAFDALAASVGKSETIFDFISKKNRNVADEFPPQGQGTQGKTARIATTREARHHGDRPRVLLVAGGIPGGGGHAACAGVP